MLLYKKMEAPKPKTQEEILITIQKELKSEQGNNFHLTISYNDFKFCIQVENKGKIFNDIFVKKLSFTEFQENQYFKLFSSPKEILEELKDRIESKNPILNERENNTINLNIFIPIAKFKQFELNLSKETIQLNENSNNLKKIIEKLFEQIEELKEENKKIKEENKEIKDENNKIKKEIKKIIEKNEEIELRLKKLETNNNNENKQIIKKNNFHWINKEVNIINYSKFVSYYGPDIILGKSTNNPYSCTEGNRNHFIEFSFIKTYYLKSIRIKVDNYECSLKTFSVELIDQNNNINNIGTFVRSKYQDNTGFQEFEINSECKGVKLNLIDNWGSGGGNFILISKIDFYVSD